MEHAMPALHWGLRGLMVGASWFETRKDALLTMRV